MTERYPPYPFSRPIPERVHRPDSHTPDPGPFHEDDLDWGLRCVTCGAKLRVTSGRRWIHAGQIGRPPNG